MLRRALDAAEDEKAAAAAAAAREDEAEDVDSTVLLPQESETQTGYGSTRAENGGDETDSNPYGEEDSTSYTSADLSQEDKEPLMERWLKTIQGCFATIADVDNLWDESEGHITRRNRLLVLFWFLVLALAYSGERSTFYLLVDRTGPFRLFSATMITSCHALLLASGMLLSAIQRRDFTFNALGIPIVDVGLMAILDVSALVLALITGYHVPPTLTVILVQWTIPLTVFFTQFTHPDGKFRGLICRNGPDASPDEGQESETLLVIEPEIDSTTLASFNTPPLPGWGGYARAHLWGSVVISLAVLLGLCPAFLTFYNPDIFSYADSIPLRTAINSVVFALACVPAAASQLYKESVFIQHKQPVDATFLNCVLSVFQFIFILLLSPLVYPLQGMGTPGDWTHLYRSTNCSANFLDGLSCFFGKLDEDTAENGYPELAKCDLSFLIVLSHVLSIIFVGVSVDKIVHAGATKIMYRGISAGIILAVIAMLIYDLYDEDFNYGLSVDVLHCVCTALLILGSEVYHRVTVQDATFETVYPETNVIYDDDA